MFDIDQKIIAILQNDYSKEFIIAISSGLILTLLQLAYKYIKNNILYGKYKGYIGDYYTYSISTREARCISQYSYKIKYRFGRLILATNDKSLKYQGEVFITDKNIYFHNKGVGHDEFNQMIFHKPFNNRLTSSIGVISCVSILNEPTAKVILITNKKIEDQKAFNILTSYKIINENLLTIIPTSEKFYTDTLINNEE